MSSNKRDSIESNIKLLNEYEIFGGSSGLMSQSKLKIDFSDRINDKGQRICRLMATMHLGCLNQELYSMAINAYENYNQVRSLDPLISIEYPVETNGMSYAVLVKDFPARFNEQGRDDLEIFARKTMAAPLEKEAARLKDFVANQGFPGKSLLSSAPFSCSAIINTIAKIKFFQKIAGSEDPAIDNNSVEIGPTNS
jgi:hypothetical protein